MIFWSNKNYQDNYGQKIKNLIKNRNKLFCNDMIYDTLIGMTDIKTKLYEARFDITNSKYYFSDDEATILNKKLKYVTPENRFYKSSNLE
jgi:glucan phosphoethanolaminetransferase (alkaline phosphatase superfamily)